MIQNNSFIFMIFKFLYNDNIILIIISKKYLI